MDYALAKELRDAGWPQAGTGKRIGPPDLMVWRKADLVYVPSLEELLEECSEKGFGLWFLEEGAWAARKFLVIEVVTGATPSEAVARLWLELQQVMNEVELD